MVVTAFDKSTLIPHETNAVQELMELPVRASFSDAEGRTVYDFGQNAAGYVAFTVEGEAGARLIVEHAEMLDHNGQFDRESMRSAEARIEYMLKGGGAGNLPADLHLLRLPLRPRRHRGQRADHRHRVDPDQLGHHARRRRSARRIRWSTGWSRTPSGRSARNFIDVPTDCPQRDERLGWTGDAQVFAATACYLHESQASCASSCAT